MKYGFRIKYNMQIFYRVAGKYAISSVFDNFFTSLPLLSELENRGLKATGTVPENRTGKCPLSESKVLKKNSKRHILICLVNVASNSLPVYPTNGHSKNIIIN
jgi:hypothetical protein